jgi:hypothetical protein
MSLEFYWKGSDSEQDINEYSIYTYWNEPSNWFVKSTVAPSENDTISSTGDIQYYSKATRAPHGGDVVYFKKLSGDPSLGLNGGPWPKTPCLFGGMAVTGGSLEWIGSSGDTAERQDYNSVVIVDQSYGCDFYDRITDETLPGYLFGKPNQTGYSADGVNWNGLNIGADNFYTDQRGKSVTINEFNGGNFYVLGHALLNVISGTADNFVYAQDMTHVINQVDECTQTTISQTWVNCDVINTIRMESPALYKGYFSHTCPTVKTKNVIISPLRSGLDYWVYRGDAEHVKVYPWQNTFRGVEEYSVFRISNPANTGGEIEYGSVEIDNLTMKNVNFYDPSIKFTGNNCEIKIDTGCTISNINTNGGNFRIGNLTDDQQITIVEGNIELDTRMYLYGSNLDTKIRLGTEGATLPGDGIRVYSTDDAYPKFYFSSGAYVNSQPAEEENTWESIKGASLSSEYTLRIK